MANRKHLRMLRKNVATWNQWRKETPEIRPNFHGVDLRQKDLRQKDLSKATFSKATLSKADLSGTNLSGTNLSGTNLSRANLSRSNLSRSNLSEANLSRANLSGADLSGSNLSVARLFSTRLDGATLTDACLWETQRTGWSIKDIICEAICWEPDRKERTLYVPGEFERLFSENTKIVLYYAGGITPIEIATLPALIQRIEAEHPGCMLRLNAIEDAPGGATVTLVIDDPGDRNPAEIAVMKTELETTSRQLIALERQVLQEASKREQAERTLSILFTQLLEQRPMSKYQIGRVGNLTDISGGHVHDFQITYQLSDLDKIGSLVADILAHHAELALPADQQCDLQAQLTTLKTQLTAHQPNQTIISEGLRSVRTILESTTGGAIGNLVATWLPVFTQLLG